MSGLGAGGMATDGRGLSVSTLLVLVAAIAVGLAVTRTLPDFLFLYESHEIVHQFSATAKGSSSAWYPIGRAFNDLSRFPGFPSRNRPSYWLEHVLYWSAPCLVSLTFAAIALRMRRPRPSRRAASLPGRAVGMAVLLALAVKFAECMVLLVASWRWVAPIWKPTWPWWNTVNGHWAYFWLTLSGPAGFAVAVGWAALALALGGRRPPAPDAIERLARAIGWAWIALALARAAGSLCLALGS